MFLPPNPVVCYVTDARSLADAQLLPPLIARAAAAGVHWIQIREKQLTGRAQMRVACEALAGARGSGARILINDRLDVAIAVGAGGVHLGENSFAAAEVVGWRSRHSTPDFLIGVSCHSLEAARAVEASGADYVFFGPVFATPSKAEFGPPQGIGRLQEVCRAVRIPVLAIGGVTVENARSCALAGAAGIAAIRMFQASEDLAELTGRLRSRLRAG